MPLARMREKKEWKICFREAVAPYGHDTQVLVTVLSGQQSWGFTLVLSPTDCVTLSRLGLRFRLCEMRIIV